MQKLAAVEEARALMNEAKDWSLWRWLVEKGKVRAVADQATGALDDLERKTKAAWSEDLKAAYRELEDAPAGSRKAKRQSEKPKANSANIDPQIKLAVRRVKQADNEVYHAKLDAEETFEQAERQMSASMAREGAQKAMVSWDLRLKAIRQAEALSRLK